VDEAMIAAAPVPPAQEESAMLVLSRKRGERILIGPNIEMIIVDISGNKVRLAFDAPQDVSIHRQEVHRRIQDEGRNAVEDDGRSSAACR
jgi:carbon storage regulator